MTIPNKLWAIRREALSTFKSHAQRILSLGLAMSFTFSAHLASARTTMSAPEALDVMGLSAEASPEEIKSRYRQLSKQYHPDTGGSTGAFIKLQNAFDTLNASTSVAPEGIPPGATILKDVVIVPQHRFSALSNLPSELRVPFYKLSILWDNTAGIAFDEVITKLAQNPKASISMKSFYEAHLNLMQSQVGDAKIIRAIDTLPMSEIGRFLNNSKSIGDSLLSAYLKEVIEHKDLVRFERIMAGHDIISRISDKHLNGQSTMPKTARLLTETPVDPMFQKAFQEVMEKRPLNEKESLEFAKRGLITWERALDHFSRRYFIDKSDQRIVAEILSQVPKSKAKAFAIIQMELGSNSVVEMPQLRQLVEGLSADKLPWNSFIDGRFFERSKDVILDILIRAENTNPGYMDQRIKKLIQDFDSERGKYGDSFIDSRIENIKKMQKKLKKEIEKRILKTSGALSCGKIFNG